VLLENGQLNHAVVKIGLMDHQFCGVSKGFESRTGHRVTAGISVTQRPAAATTWTQVALKLAACNNTAAISGVHLYTTVVRSGIVHLIAHAS
jgi:hypothetical protein